MLDNYDSIKKYIKNDVLEKRIEVGNKVHKAINIFIIEKKCDENKIEEIIKELKMDDEEKERFDMFIKFFKDCRNIKPLYSEYVLYDTQTEEKSIIDLIFEMTDNYGQKYNILIDIKTFSQVFQNFNLMKRQLSRYKRVCEQNKIKIDYTYLLWLEKNKFHFKEICI